MMPQSSLRVRNLSKGRSNLSREGILWRAYQRHHGKDERAVLSWQAPTLTMYPAHPRAPIESLYAEDPVFAASEYGAEFRDSSSALINRDALESVTSSGVLERPPVAGRRYFGFIDAADGAKSGGDSMCLAIAHREDRTIVLDLVREVKPPFSPERVVTAFVKDLKAYRLSAVQADIHARGVLEELFRARGIRYETTAPAKSDLFIDLSARVNSGSVDLLDHVRLREQLLALERHTTPHGRERIVHPKQRGAHDDIANAVAGAVARASETARMTVMQAMALEEAHLSRQEIDARWRFENAYPQHREALMSAASNRSNAENLGSNNRRSNNGNQ